MKYKFYLMFRKLLCRFNIHDYECQNFGKDNGGDYALLYCFYCWNAKKKSYYNNGKKENGEF